MIVVDAKPIKILGKTAGHLRADGTFIAYREEQHVFRKFDGVGLSYKVLEKLRRAKCREIKFVIYRKGGKLERYTTTVNQMLKDGVPYTDRECDCQRILPFRCMTNPTLKNWVRE